MSSPANGISEAQSIQFPDEIPLGGVDYFMLALDAIVRRHGSSNTCHIILSLDQPISSGDLEEILCRHQIFSYLTSLRLSTFGAKLWKLRGSNTPTVMHFNDISDAVDTIRIKPRKESPIRISTLGNTTTTTILLSWTHSLADAHGAERLVELLGMNSPWSDKLIAPRDTDSWKSKFKIGKSIARHLFAMNKTPFSAIGEPRTPYVGKATYHRFSIPISSYLETCASCSAELFPSLAGLAASMIASWQAVLRRGETPGALYVPVPHDLRRRGSASSAIGNYVTFMYFRVEFVNDMTLKDIVGELIIQMYNSVEQRLPAASRAFFDSWMPLPLPLYTRLLTKPTHGNTASFFFSDLGKHLVPTTRLGGRKIVGITHFPPNITPPGFTVVTFQTENNKEFIVVADQGSAEELEIHNFERDVREQLCKGGLIDADTPV